MGDLKDKIISELDILRHVSASEEGGVFKVRQYAAAIKTLKALPGPIRSMADVPLEKGNGIGEKIQLKIAKILEHGSLDIAPAARAAATALETFRGIYGVGPKKAEELVAAGYTTLASLRAAAAKEPKLLTKNQCLGLQYYEDIQERIPRSEMDAHSAVLMAAKPAGLEGMVVGSYRRGRPDSGDIDMIVRTTAPLATYVDILKARGYLTDVLAQGESKCLAICRLVGGKARRLDLLVASPEAYPFSVLYFTGSDGFNVEMRRKAQERGFTLNEHALTHVRTGKTVGGVRSERDIFAALKIAFREPTERTGPEACYWVP